MAMETQLGPDGVSFTIPEGSEEETAALRASYEHLIALRDEVITMGLLPPLDTWDQVNPHLGA